MNKISVESKKITRSRDYVLYHYHINKPNRIRVKPSQPKPVSNKKDVCLKKAAASNKQRPTKPNVKPRDVVRPKRVRNKSKGKFAPDIDKIRSIRGIGKGKILAILAPGPSILEAEIEKLFKITSIDAMTINKPDSRYWPTEYWMFCDRTQYNRNKEEFHKYTKTLINSISIKIDHPKQIKVSNLPGKGFSTDLCRGFHIGRSTTFSAMQVAAWMDYDKIFIFGCDMCRVVIEKDGKKKSILHSYGTNPDVPEKVREKRFEKEAEFYTNASKIMSEELRQKYYFCSTYNPWPFVEMFNRIDQKEAISFMLKCAEESNG